MIDAVKEAKQRTLAALKSWERARAAVNDPTNLPNRLDQVVLVAREVVGTVRQDIVIELDAVMVELADIVFPNSDDEGLSLLERETLALHGVLDKFRRAASHDGFAEVEENLRIPPGLRMPAGQISEQLQSFVASIEALRPALNSLAGRDAMEPRDDSNALQTALIHDQIEEIGVKVDLALLKTQNAHLIDISGLASISQIIERSLGRFLATLRSAAIAVSQWLREEAPALLAPIRERVARATAGLVGRAAWWIKSRKRASWVNSLKRRHPPPAGAGHDRGPSAPEQGTREREQVLEPSEADQVDPRLVGAIRNYASCIVGSHRAALYLQFFSDKIHSKRFSEMWKDDRAGFYKEVTEDLQGLTTSLAGNNALDNVEFKRRAACTLVFIMSELDVELHDEDICDILSTEREYMIELAEQGRERMLKPIETDVLIIEDEPLIAMELQEILENLGHRVVGVARTRGEAIESARSERPGLILADIQLADGSSGLDAVRDILQMFEVTVIFITAYPERFLSTDHPQQSYLIAKPFRPSEVSYTIIQALLYHSKEYR
jgi:CheY-like chemotaxis protein